MSFKPNPNLKNILNKKFAAALDNATDVLLNKAKNNAPVKSGKLKKGIKKNTTNISNLETEVISEEEYSKAVEYGSRGRAANPFMRSALKESRNKMIKKFKNII